MSSRRRTPATTSTPVGKLVPAVALVCLAAVLLWPAAAHAGPIEPTMGLAALEAKLDASGTVGGYFKTVVKGATIETIPATVLAVTVSPNAALWGAPDRLVLFEATGPVISKYGGIASGMSGSPLFVDDDGTDRLVGAVSYGDWFTLGGLGLATPIEDMVRIETDRGVFTTSLALPEPVRTSRGTIDRIVVAPSDSKAELVPKRARTAVMTPLASLQLGGIPSSSRVFKRLQKRLAGRGMSLKAAAAGSYDPTFETTLTGGSSVAALGSRGSLWFGGAGTTTYATTDTVLAFGHPMLWEGRVSLALTNAWVHGIWGSSISPYKMISPTKLRGSFTQDRVAGLAGRIDELPTEIPIDATATLVEDSFTATSTSYAMPWIMKQWWYSDLPAMSAYMAVSKAIDDYWFEGSAWTTSTVVVSDGSETYTVTRTNLWDSSWDVGYYSIYDLYDMIWTLVYDRSGLYPAQIKSVDFEAALTSTRAAASVVDVEAPEGLRAGDNPVKVSVVPHGVVDTQTIDATISIPGEGRRPMGQLLAKAARSWVSGVSDYDDDPRPARPTVADRVEQLKDYEPNNNLIVRFAGTLPTTAPSGSTETTVIETTVSTSFYLGGHRAKRTPQFFFYPPRPTVAYKRSGSFDGWVRPVSVPTTVTVLRRTVGSAVESTLAQIPVTRTIWGWGAFKVRYSGLRKNTRLTFLWPGDDASLAATEGVTVNVRSAVRLIPSARAVPSGRSVVLRAYVHPPDAGGVVLFQVLTRGRWTNIGLSPLFSSGVAIGRFRPMRPGRHVIRAIHGRSRTNHTSVSPPVVVVAR